MKDLLITVHNGGDEAVAAVERIGKDWREQLEEAADEIERLRPAYATAVQRLASEIDRLRLTDAEREAIRNAADAYAVRGAADGRESVNAATLRGLLERLGGGE